MTLWNIDAQKIAEGYGISVEDFLETVNGSGTSPITEAKVAAILGGTRVRGQLPYDVVAKERIWQLIEVRNICSVQPNFAPSTATGKGRFYDEDDHWKKLRAIDSFVFCDLTKKLKEFPKFYEIGVEEVIEDMKSGLIKEGKMTKKKFFARYPYEKYALKP
jgi:hypothetical protein